MVGLFFWWGSKVIYKFLTVQDVGASDPCIVQGSTVPSSVYPLQEDFGCFSCHYLGTSTHRICCLSLRTFGHSAVLSLGLGRDVNVAITHVNITPHPCRPFCAGKWLLCGTKETFYLPLGKLV